MSLQVWEKPRASAAPHLDFDHQASLNARIGEIDSLIQAAFRPPSEQRRAQADRIAHLLERAEEIAVYREAFAKAGIAAHDFKSLADISRFPTITKQQMIDAGRAGCLHPRYRSERTYPTWSSGSSGLTLPIEFDPEAVITDTLHGARQLALQSAGRLGPESLTAHYYTCPWWTDRIADQWQSAFIASLVPAARAARTLREWGRRPDALTGYPSLLQQLAKEVVAADLSLQLAVTNSEQSTRLERDRLEAAFSCPVLDEYSSEELTRIAIELPDKTYYVCEDSVFLEILHPETREPVPDGEWGEAVVTGLLNAAMPFIRYATGDLVKRPRNFGAPWRGIGWSPIEAIGGRMLDSFLRPDGTIVPSGAMLDVIYRAFYDTDVCVERFELVQISDSEARLDVVPCRGAQAQAVPGFVRRVEELLAFTLDAPIKLLVGRCEPTNGTHGKRKRRPIRREFVPNGGHRRRSSASSGSRPPRAAG